MKAKWLWRTLLVLVLELALGEFGIGYLTRLLGLPYLLHLVVYKTLELLVILALNRWLLQQRLWFSPLKWTTILWLGLFWLTIAWATFGLRGPGRVGEGLVVGVVAAATEETLFRGMIFATLAKHWRLWPAMLTSGVGFGLLHLLNLTHQAAGITGLQILQAAGMGVMLAAMYARAGSLLAPMAFHFTLDFVAVAIHGVAGTPVGDWQTLLSGSVFWCLAYIGIAAVIVYAPHRPLRLLEKLSTA